MIQLAKISLIGLLSIAVVHVAVAQTSGVITVNGDLDKYYPVTFFDGGWSNNVATELELGRSNVHQDGNLKGSIIAKFRFHVTNWGHGSNFIDADIRQYTNVNPKLIAGWKDATSYHNSTNVIIIWLRGGNTTYSYKGNYAVNPTVYDGVQNPLPYREAGEPEIITPSHSYKTTIDSTVNNFGMSYSNTAYFNGTDKNYFAGKVGIGTSNAQYTLHSASYNNTNSVAAFLWGQYYGAAVGVASTSTNYAFNVFSNINANASGGPGGARSLFYVRADGNVGIGTANPQAKLAVNGDIYSKRVKVTVAPADWPDYVFDNDYKLPTLQEVEQYIKANHHLSDIPAAAAIEKDGLDLGEMNKKLLQKVEELTLYLIDQQKQIDQLKQQNEKLTKEIREK